MHMQKNDVVPFQIVKLVHHSNQPNIKLIQQSIVHFFFLQLEKCVPIKDECSFLLNEVYSLVYFCR